MNGSIPSVVAVAAWAALAALVAGYTVNAYVKTVNNLPEGDFATGTPDSSFGGGDFSSSTPGFSG